MPVYFIYCIAWMGLMVIGISNGALRTLGYGKLMPELRAHQISCFTGIFFLGLFVWLLDRMWQIESRNQALLIGSTWLILTVLFEFGFGHFIMKHPWSQLLLDYRIDEGRLWILVLLWTSVVPFVIYSIRQSQS